MMLRVQIPSFCMGLYHFVYTLKVEQLSHYSFRSFEFEPYSRLMPKCAPSLAEESKATRCASQITVLCGSGY